MQTSNPSEGVVIAEVPEGTLTASNVDPFREEFNRILSESHDLKVLILDLSGFTFMDSAGLGTLIALLKKSSEQGREIKLAGLRKEVRVVFEITRAYKLFDIFDTTEEALRVVE
ncbi:STAS domain-containing protein [Desulfonatronospira sp.]|uniref:STAS domain-containing protein n=1 Tax=Desulfonatronospira sp. TaxID=1962951 RepID=UPI0025BC152F|nr:STAS domain-containing protein [Desulfonatronospira sp.]